MSSNIRAKNGRLGTGIAAVSLALLLVPGTALARTGGIGEGPRLKTSAPDLRSVEIRSVDLNDSEDEFVNFCFDENIQSTGLDGSSFTIEGYNSDITVPGNTADVSPDDERCVQVGFAAGTDVREFTIGVVADGAVMDVQGNENLTNSEDLKGSETTPSRGRTTAPDLVGISRNNTQNRVDFTFDEQLDETTDVMGASTFSPAAFGFYEPNGDEQRGAVIISVEGRKVTVEFAEAAQVSEGERFFVDEGAVTDGTGEVSPAASDDGRTSDPDLTSTERASKTEVNFSFDENISNVDPARFIVYSEDATRFVGESFSKIDGDTVRVRFSIRDFARQTVSAVALTAAVSSEEAGQDPNTLGDGAIGTLRESKGRTDGPDLRRAEYNPRSEQVTFVFDEKVDNDADVLAAGFSIIDRSGNITEGVDIVRIEGRKVVVNFGSDVSSARGASVARGTVEDFQSLTDGDETGRGNINPSATVGRSV